MLAAGDWRAPETYKVVLHHKGLQAWRKSKSSADILRRVAPCSAGTHYYPSIHGVSNEKKGFGALNLVRDDWSTQKENMY